MAQKGVTKGKKASTEDIGNNITVDRSALTGVTNIINYGYHIIE